MCFQHLQSKTGMYLILRQITDAFLYQFWQLIRFFGHCSIKKVIFVVFVDMFIQKFNTLHEKLHKASCIYGRFYKLNPLFRPNEVGFLLLKLQRKLHFWFVFVFCLNAGQLSILLFLCQVQYLLVTKLSIKF